MKNNCCGKWRLLIPVIILAAVAALALAVHLLWNGILVEVTGAKAISYWQALGLLVLAKILFGRFPGCGRCGPGWRHRRMKEHWQEHWQSLSPEQRGKMREEMRRRFGDWPRPPGCGCDEEEPDESGGASPA